MAATKSGDLCTHCKAGVFNVASSQPRGDYQIRYLRCSHCGNTDKCVVPSAEVRRRSVPK